MRISKYDKYRILSIVDNCKKVEFNSFDKMLK